MDYIILIIASLGWFLFGVVIMLHILLDRTTKNPNELVPVPVTTGYTITNPFYVDPLYQDPPQQLYEEEQNYM